jgi:ketosteroid isomerase-like protein
MSQEKVETIRQLFAAFNRLDAIATADFWAADGEWRPAYIGGGLLEGAVFRGREGIIEFVELQPDTWENIVAEPVDVRDLGARVLVEVHLRGLGRASGTPVARVTWNVFEIRDGKVATGAVYASQEEALEAVGRAG